ncbi:MAG: RecB-family nuclease [Thermoprotei archaeon]
MILVLHNVTSTQRLVDTARLAFQNGVMFVVTKVGGTAAQAGIPEASKLAYRLGKPFLVLPDLKDAVELLSPSKVFLVTNNSQKRLTSEDLTDKVMVVIPGTENGFSKFDLGLGDQVRIADVEVDQNPVVQASLLFYCLRKT